MSEPVSEAVLYRDVTTTSRGGKWLFSTLALAQFAIWIPLAFEMGPVVFSFGIPGAVAAAGLLLWYGVIRASVTASAIVVQKGLRERRIALEDVESVEASREAVEENYMMGARRTRLGESFLVYGAHRTVAIRTRSGEVVTVMSDAPDLLAAAIEKARADRAPAARVRVADDTGADEVDETAAADAKRLSARS